jgi:hypothetical protein
MVDYLVRCSLANKGMFKWMFWSVKGSPQFNYNYEIALQEFTNFITGIIIVYYMLKY